ncbi:MAG: IgGFc-binding protein, partial [Nannocystaceae bacterium]
DDSDSDPTNNTNPTDPTDDSDSDPTETTDSDTDPVCEEGTIICEDNEAKVCDGMGGFSEEEICEFECVDGVGCVVCIPGDFMCDEMGNSLECNEAGDAWEPYETCDGVQGVMCNEDTGLCDGACSKAALGLSYIGCDYYPTVTQQYDGYNGNGVTFAAAVANTSGSPAQITVTRGDNEVTSQMVMPNSVQVISLPWVNELTLGTGPTIQVEDGAYRLRSDQPVTVYQYNPLAANVTNDASVLLPVNTWTGRYLVASYPHWSPQNFNKPGFMAVVASEDNTEVTLYPSATSTPVQAGAGVAADATGVVTLNQGDALQVLTANPGDLTGMIVEATRPIQVIGGHSCTNVPANITACDHLEESMFPIETLAKEYIVVPPVQVPNNNLEKAQIVRVIAAEANTAVTFDPDQGADAVLTNAGDFIELDTTVAKFKVSADKKIAVAQYMVGQSANFGTSDPAMLMAIATEQYRTSYLFHAPTGWNQNFVDVIAPDGATVEVDGMAVNNFEAVGATGFSHAHVLLNNGGDGNHSVTADVPVGISVYGVVSFGSYWYPGGLELERIIG